MEIEDYLLMIGELYVAQRQLRHERDVTIEEANSLKIEVAELQSRIDNFEEAGA